MHSDQIIVSSAMPGSVLQSLHDPINETSIDATYTFSSSKEEIMVMCRLYYVNKGRQMLYQLAVVC